MASVLIDHWLGGDAAGAIAIDDDAAVEAVCHWVRSGGAEAGLLPQDTEAMAIAAGELCQNQRFHASRGFVAIRRIEREKVSGIEIVAVDQGPGMEDPTRALRGRSDEWMLGVGLAGVRHMVDEMDLDVRFGAGTAIWVRKFSEPTSRRREVAILGRPLVGEAVSGDHALFIRSNDSLLLAVADGIGHGPEAFVAARQGIASVRASVLGLSASPADILSSADVALRESRGAVMAVARVDESTEIVEHAGVGDTRTLLIDPKDTKVLSSISGFVGHPKQRRGKARLERLTLAASQAIVMATDGLSRRAGLSEGSGLLGLHPMLIAHHLFLRFAKANDDVLVLVAR